MLFLEIVFNLFLPKLIKTYILTMISPSWVPNFELIISSSTNEDWLVIVSFWMKILFIFCSDICILFSFFISFRLYCFFFFETMTMHNFLELCKWQWFFDTWKYKICSINMTNVSHCLTYHLFLLWLKWFCKMVIFTTNNSNWNHWNINLVSFITCRAIHPIIRYILSKLLEAFISSILQCFNGNSGILLYSLQPKIQSINRVAWFWKIDTNTNGSNCINISIV